ncbi:MAG TPA: hypothetical protein VEH50_10000, partial [Methylomirabilota bacterium]|nr:hypothetical protein [Methylomirabilota bacterium]
MRRRSSAGVAFLLCALAAWSCTAQQRQSQHDFLAVLIDAASKKPVPSLRIILAPKKVGTGEIDEGNHFFKEGVCTIDTALTGVSNDRGEVKISNVAPGEYVVFQIPSGVIKPELNGTVVTWFGGVTAEYNFSSFGSVLVKQGSLAIVGGKMVVLNGYMEGYVHPSGTLLGISTTAAGELLTVRVPSAGSAPVTIEINT